MKANNIKGGKMFPIGENVIVTTCNGEFRGKVNGYSKGFSGEKLYKVSGDKIITTTRNAVLDTGRKLDTRIHCPKCVNSSDCCFKEEQINQ